MNTCVSSRGVDDDDDEEEEEEEEEEKEETVAFTVEVAGDEACGCESVSEVGNIPKSLVNMFKKLPPTPVNRL